MSANRDVVSAAFAEWMAGTGHVGRIFDPAMTWEIVGRSVAARRYGSTQEFTDAVLAPFAARFGTVDPFRPVRIRAVYEDEGQRTVTVVWDGRGTTTAGTTYENTYAWFLTLGDAGTVVDGTAFFDSVAFDELWTTVTP